MNEKTLNTPKELSERISMVLGVNISELIPVSGGGYTVARRFIAKADNGKSFFVKLAADQDTTTWLREENLVYSKLKADFLPEFIAFDESADFPMLILEDLSAGSWKHDWTPENIQRVITAIEKIGETKPPAELPSLEDFRHIFSCWQKVQQNPQPFLSLGLCSEEWLMKNLPLFISVEKTIKLEADKLVHLDMRSDNICFKGDKTYIVDWNWARRGNPKLDLLLWLPTLHVEGGPAPWEYIIEDVDLITGLTGNYAFSAVQPPPKQKQGKALRELQLKVLKSVFPWMCKALKIELPT